MNTPIDKIKSAVIMALHFFEEINGFKEEGKTDEAGYEKDCCKHSALFFVN